MNGDKARILVVDDNDAARYSLVRMLQAEGHDLLEAASGRETLDMARAHKPDMLVLDVRLPDIIGFDLTEQLRSDEATRSIAILQVSASYTAGDAQAEGLRRGADAYLTHPIDPCVLSATVNALLRIRSAEQLANRERARAEEARARAEQERASADEARARAEASEARQRFLADMVPQLVWSSDACGKPDYFNRRWFEFNGTSPDESEYAMDWSGSLHPDDRDRFTQAWNHSLETGEPLEIECRRWSPPVGAYRWQLIRANAMRDANGAIVRWFGTSTEIEGQKKALAEHERLLAEAQSVAAERDNLVSRLQKEAQRKNEFLAILSHELRNPLAPIRNSVYILQRAAPEGQQAQRARDVIERQVQHMTRLVDDLLDITRIARGKIRLQREPVELNTLVRRSADDHRELIRQSGLALEVHLSEEPLPVYGDPTRLAQVIDNLLQNAAKFTPAGGRIWVSLCLESANEGPDAAVILVRDTGAGIQRATLDHLFEPFTQGESTLDRSRGGLGLALALAKGIVELHGGTIRAKSDGPGRGSEFIVTVPLERREAPAVAPRARTELDRASPRRVLVIEDLPDSAETLREALELSRHVVAVAHDGLQGLAVARSFRPEVVLCDIGLPVLDGYEVARRMREDPALKTTFLIALSGYALQEDVERSKDAGFDRHLAKPPRLEELEQLVQEAPARA